MYCRRRRNICMSQVISIPLLLMSVEFIPINRSTKSEDPEVDTMVSLVKGLDAARTDSAFWDITFVFVNELNSELGANKCILCNRNAYFSGMFRNSSMIESIQNRVEILNHKRSIFSAMLEFLYTGKVSLLSAFDIEQCSELLLLANEYMIDELKYQCQQSLSELISPSNVSKMFCFAEDIEAHLLKQNIKVT